YLHIDGLSCFKEFAKLIKNTKGSISRVWINNIDNSKAENMGVLINAIANNCPKVKYLFIPLEPKDFIYVKDLLLNCKYLRYILFENENDNDDVNYNIGDELLNILTKFSPKSLIILRLKGNWKYSIDIFKEFFESCREKTIGYIEFC